MAISRSVKRSLIFNELSETEQKKFDIVEKKALHNIDTLYYSIKLIDDGVDVKNENISKLIYFLNL